MSVMADLMCTGNMAAELSQLINKLMTVKCVMCCSSEVVPTPTYFLCLFSFFFFSEKKLNLFIVFTH